MEGGQSKIVTVRDVEVVAAVEAPAVCSTRRAGSVVAGDKVKPASRQVEELHLFGHDDTRAG